jgi:hypothetical protein
LRLQRNYEGQERVGGEKGGLRCWREKSSSVESRFNSWDLVYIIAVNGVTRNRVYLHSSISKRKVRPQPQTGIRVGISASSAAEASTVATKTKHRGPALCPVPCALCPVTIPLYLCYHSLLCREATCCGREDEGYTTVRVA